MSIKILNGSRSTFYDLDTAYSNGNIVGRISWDQDNATAQVGLNTNVVLHMGQDDMWYVKNQTGASIPKGSVVYAAGTVGASGRILAAPYIANGTIAGRFILGMTAEAIADGADGYVIAKGKLRGFNTNSFTAGTVLWASPTTAGAMTSTEPSAPNIKAEIAFVVHQHTNNGVLAVRRSSGTRLSDDSQVEITSPSTGQLLRYNSNRWENWSPNFLTAEADTLQTVTSRGSSTTTGATFGGNVGIGTSSPSNKLDVIGNILVQGTQGFNAANETASIYIGDTASEIRAVYDGGLDFYQNSTHRMRIQGGTGNVGIGTTAPTAKLQVEGDGIVINTENVAGAKFLYFRYSNGGDLRSDSFLTFSTGGSPSEKMRITSAGEVGIGTSSPSFSLSVDRATTATAQFNTNGNMVASFRSSTVSANAWAGLKLMGDEGSGIWFSDEGGTKNHGYISQRYTGQMDFATGTDSTAAATVKMTILSAGNVGIGTTAPQKALEVISGANNFVSVGVEGLGVGQWAGIHFGYRESNLSYRKSAIVFERTDLTANDAQGKIHILNGPQGGAGSATLSDAKLTVAENGNIGIGTTAPVSHSPTRRTLVVSDTVNGANVEIWGNNAGGKSILQSVGGDTYVGNLANGSGAGTTYITSGNGSTYTTFLANGNVGIGTTAPATRLHVDVSGHAMVVSNDIGNRRIYFGTGGTGEPDIQATLSNGTARQLSINAAGGNVGIGTTAPAQKFHVQGSNLMATFRNSDTAANQYTQLEFLAGSRDAYIWLGNQNTTSWAGDGGLNIYTGTGNMDFWTAATQKVRITASGNMGIGTMAPVSYAKLDVFGNAKFGDGSSSNVLYGGFGGAIVRQTAYQGYNILYAGGDFESVLLGGNNDQSNYYRNQLHYFQDRAGATRIFIASNGDVGIGTTSPTAPLEITNTGSAGGGYSMFNSFYSAAKQWGMRKYGIDNGTGIAFSSDVQFSSTWYNATRIGHGQNANNPSFQSYYTTYLATTSGKVGIGTDSPSQKLHVVGNAAITGVTSTGNRKLSLGILDINVNTESQVRINTTIPFALGGADFTVNIKGFRYGSTQMVSLSVGWHYYLSSFFNETAISNGAWKPTISLAQDANGFVVIYLPDPSYWAKLYVESVYSNTYGDAYSSGWNWTDANLSNCTNVEVVPYQALATDITGTAGSETLATVTGRGATTASQVSFTKTDDNAISVGTIRGRAVGSQAGDFIHLYERVHIGSPNGWGAPDTAAPSFGLSVYGGANIGYGNNGGLTVSGTLSATGTITAERYRGNNSLVLNTFTTANPSSNVFLYSQPNDRDSWIYLDSADTGSNWGIYHRQIDSAVSGLEGNSIGFIGGGASGLRAYIGLSTGNGYFAGTISASNFSGSSSGTNTGDQTNITGNAGTVTVNSGNSSAAWYPILWHSGNNVYSSSGVAEIYPAGGYARFSYINTTDNDESGITRFVIKNGDSYHRSATTTVAADIIRGVASGTWGINVTGYSTQLNGYAQQVVYTILDGPANGPVIKVRYDGATVNRYIDIGYKDGFGTYYEGFKIFNGDTPTWQGSTILHAGNYNSYALPLSGGVMTGKILAPSYGNDVYGGAFEIRERGYVLATQDNWSYSPAISFHWGNRFAVRLGFDASGFLAVDNVRFLNASNYNSYAPTLTGGGASGTWGINITGNSASSTLLNQSGSLTTQYGNGTIGYSYALVNPQTGLFPAVDNSNAIITVNRHPDSYYSQLGFSSNGQLYYRSFSAVAINTSQPWQNLLTSSNYNSYAPTLTGGGASGSWGINVTGNAATASSATTSNQLGGIDADRFVFGDGPNGRSKNMSNGDANVSNSTNSSGFYFGLGVTGMPDADWWNWMTVAGNPWSGGDGYRWQMAGSFWGDVWRIRRMTSGGWNSWLTIIHSGNLGSNAILNQSASAQGAAFRINGTGSVENMAIGGAGSFGGSAKSLFIAQTTTAPNSNPTGGVVTYVEDGIMKARSASGNITFLTI